MVVHLYTLAWNDADMLGFFFRHYDSWVDLYIVYDDGSTDETLPILQAHPRVEVRRFVRNDPESFVESHRHLHNSVWRQSRGAADWVVITAIDEHLHVPGVAMRDYLEQCRAEGVTYIPAAGYQMVSEKFPDRSELLCETRRWGATCDFSNKTSIFDPNAVEETNYLQGRHTAQLEGRLQRPKQDRLLLLHYKYLDFDRTFRRHHELSLGLESKDVAMRWGHRYWWSREEFRENWDSYAARLVDVASVTGWSRPDARSASA
jgi:glycosyl transferase family 2